MLLPAYACNPQVSDETSDTFECMILKGGSEWGMHEEGQNQNFQVEVSVSS